jgi:hypothetical protein
LGLTLFTDNAIFTVVVNKPAFVKLEGTFKAEALRILWEIPGLSVINKPGGPDGRVDAILYFANRQAPVVIEFKQRANAAGALQLAHYAKAHPDTPTLLIAGETTKDARAILDDHGIGVIDGLGNAHIELPGLLLHLEGHRPPRRRVGASPPTRLRGKAGLAAQALLLRPDRTWQVQDLADEARVAPSLAHRILARLEQEAIVTAEGSGPRRVRRITNPTALLDLWVEENVERPTRTLGHMLAQTPRQLITQLGTNLGDAGIDYALTGPAGASLVAPFITAIPVAEVWVTATASPEELRQAARADPVAEGQNVIFLQARDDAPLAFREQTKGLWVTNRFRLYADLRRDPRRGREQADHLRREVIGF